MEDMEHVTILVMGPTGAGKTSFVNSASESALLVHTSLESCTTHCQVSKPFVVNNREVTLVDTPGFNDTDRSDHEVLSLICDDLVAMYTATPRQHIHGVIYLHPISHTRVSGSYKRSMLLYQALCGHDALCNTAVVTTMWEVTDPKVGVDRETQLMSKDAYFKPAVEAGAQILRYTGTQISAFEVLRQLLQVGNRPIPLRIQQELVEEKRTISQTDAGKVLVPKSQTEHGPQLSDVLILVMGQHGSGKSTFIKTASGSDPVAGGADPILFSQPFAVNSRIVVLVEVPGFDDPRQSPSDTLLALSDWLAERYIRVPKQLLHGVIYVHSISNNKVTWASMSHIKLYQDICGGDALCNTVIVTSMWHEVNSSDGRKFERALVNQNEWFKFAVKRGASLWRDGDTQASVQRIIRPLLKNHPAPLHLQQELIDEDKQISHTAAGEALRQSLDSLSVEYLKEEDKLQSSLTPIPYLLSQSPAEHEITKDRPGVSDERRLMLTESKRKLEDEKVKLDVMDLSYIRRSAFATKGSSSPSLRGNQRKPRLSRFVSGLHHLCSRGAHRYEYE